MDAALDDKLRAHAEGLREELQQLRDDLRLVREQNVSMIDTLREYIELQTTTRPDTQGAVDTLLEGHNTLVTKVRMLETANQQATMQPRGLATQGDGAATDQLVTTSSNQRIRTTSRAASDAALFDTVAEQVEPSPQNWNTSPPRSPTTPEAAMIIDSRGDTPDSEERKAIVDKFLMPPPSQLHALRESSVASSETFAGSPAKPSLPEVSSRALARDTRTHSRPRRGKPNGGKLRPANGAESLDAINAAGTKRKSSNGEHALSQTTTDSDEPTLHKRAKVNNAQSTEDGALITRYTSPTRDAGASADNDDTDVASTKELLPVSESQDAASRAASTASTDIPNAHVTTPGQITLPLHATLAEPKYASSPPNPMEINRPSPDAADGSELQGASAQPIRPSSLRAEPGQASAGMSQQKAKSVKPLKKQKLESSWNLDGGVAEGKRDRKVNVRLQDSQSKQK